MRHTIFCAIHEATHDIFRDTRSDTRYLPPIYRLLGYLHKGDISWYILTRRFVYREKYRVSQKNCVSHCVSCVALDERSARLQMDYPDSVVFGWRLKCTLGDFYRGIEKSKSRNIWRRNLSYDDNVLIDADMQMPAYRPLDEANQPTFEESNGAVWVRRDESTYESYLEPQRLNPTHNTIMKETVLDGAGLDTVSDDFADSSYEQDEDVAYGPSEEVIAWQHFQTKLTVSRKVIVASIDIHKILPHLSFVEYPHEFKHIANRNKTSAVVLLIERLLE
ncbi:hypothetical protein DPMN_000378 [Dreissena polymorpha]|uniref:Uncharacterized protein n=1 Tax=Dreissena polymorpha TaxID=45954 RepID=A0A9D4MH90_DREPO|nr:hypothetical protein DPMN_000378 [Dreissena polymorpha]